MKRILTLVLLLFLSINLFAQSDGISYQAVIIGPDDLELPGFNSEGNYLPNEEIDIRFTILNPGTGIEHFTEVQETETDEFGGINLIIGEVEHDDFEKIDWNGELKSLKVEVDFDNGDGFVVMSTEKLTYVPYVAHRDITATGTLEVDGNTTLEGALTIVDEPTTLGGTFNVDGGNRSNLSGDLNVDGETNLNNTLNVTGKSVANLSGALNVGDPAIGPPDGDQDAPTTLNGTLTVVGESTFTGLVADDLTINNSTELNGSVDVNSDSQIRLFSNVHTDAITYTNSTDQKQQVNGTDPGLDMGNYPVLVEGSTQGIAIKVSENSRNGNNFVSFWDQSNTMWGRIEGEVDGEFANNADYIFDQTSLDYDVYEAEIDLGFAISDAAIGALQLIKTYVDYRPCIGIAPCVGGPGPADIAFAATEVIADGIQVGFANDALNRAKGYRVQYNDNKLEFVGVSYASGAGDYAEYLMRIDLSEKMTYGDIIGVKGGKISKNLSGAERMMVVSFKPIVLGNMPQASEKDKYEKVAFMGQVPVKVFGKVNIGDYIIPSGNNDGIGLAVSPANITTNQINKIVGIAWSESNDLRAFKLINVAVGLNHNDNNPIVEKLEQKVTEQSKEISDLKAQIAEIKDLLLNGSAVSKTIALPEQTDTFETSGSYNGRKYEVVDTEHGEIVYWEITEEDFENGLKLAEEQMRAEGVDIENHILWKKLKKDPVYKKDVFTKLKSRLDKQFHFHKDDLNKEKH